MLAVLTALSEMLNTTKVLFPFHTSKFSAENLGFWLHYVLR